MPNGYTLAGFAIGTLRLAKMATLHLRELPMATKPKHVPLNRFLFPANPGSKIHLLQLGIHGEPSKCDLRKIMGKIRYHYFQN